MSKLTKYLHILTLAAFAFAQPIFDFLSRTPEFFYIRRSQSIDIVILILSLNFLFGLTLVFLEILFAKFKKVENYLHYFFIAILFFLITLGFSNYIFSKYALISISLSLALSIFATWRYSLNLTLNKFVTYLSPSLLIFPLIFLLNSKINKIVFQKPIKIAEQKIETNSQLPPIIFIVFDEFPISSIENSSGQINSFMFPNFADLAQHATWYRQGTSVSGYTEHAVPAILSGLYPNTNQVKVPSYLDYPNNLFTILAPYYEMNVYEQVTHLCPDQLCSATSLNEDFRTRINALSLDIAVIYGYQILPRRLQKLLPRVEGEWNGFIKAKVRNRGLKAKGLVSRQDWEDDQLLLNEFLKSLSATKNNRLNFLHITFPHVPYRYYPSGKTYLKGMQKTNERGFVGVWPDEDFVPQRALQRHLMQVAYADKLLGQLLARMRELEIFDRSLLIVTADHGTSFQKSNYSRFIVDTNASNIMRVPYFIKLPEQTKANLSDLNLESIDLLPTVLNQLEIKSEVNFDGQSVAQLQVTNRKQKKFFQFDAHKHTELVFPDKLDSSPIIAVQESAFGHNLEKLNNFGPRPEFLGQNAKDLQLKELATNFKAATKLKAVNLAESYIPGFVYGKLTEYPNSCPDFDLAITVNSIIQATTKVACENSVNNFAVVLPETAFKNGNNLIQIFLLPQKQ